MDYKEILEDQIKKLQQLQKENIADDSFGKLTDKVKRATDIAEQIRRTVEDARNIELTGELPTLITRVDGLTVDEGKVMDSLVEAWNIYLKLEREMPNEINEFVNGINRCQDLLALRVVRREHPEGWQKKTLKGSQ